MAENPELLNKVNFRRASFANWVNDGTGDSRLYRARNAVLDASAKIAINRSSTLSARFALPGKSSHGPITDVLDRLFFKRNLTNSV